MKLFYKIIILFFIIAFQPAQAQDGMFQQKKERKKLWRKWRSKKEAYNPYLKKKGKDKPSARIAKGDKKELKRQKRQFKRQLKRSKRKGS